jgi:hypothetical protein
MYVSDNLSRGKTALCVPAVIFNPLIQRYQEDKRDGLEMEGLEMDGLERGGLEREGLK